MRTWMRFPGLKWLARWFDSPILNRELRTLLRSPRSFFWLALYLIAMLIALSVAWTQIGPHNRDIAARVLFSTIIFTQGILFTLLAPILTAGSLAGEHERRTFDLLATTPLSGYHVVLAKCFSAVCYVILLVIASLPVLAISFLFGGVGWVEMVLSAVMVLSSVLVSGMIGVVCSAWIRRTFFALMLSLALVVANYFSCLSGSSLLSLPLAMAMEGAAAIPLGVLLVVVLVCGVQVLIFLGLMHLARNGYLSGSQMPFVRPKLILYNPVVIKERRRRYPYYLIDPLAAPKPVRDGANPVYVRDTRHQPLGRLDFVIRISYVCLVISFFMGFALLGELGYYERDMAFGSVVLRRMFNVSHVVVSVILIGVPLFASMAFTGEKENGTFLALMTTLLSATQILRAKIKIILRYSLVFVAALFIPGFCVLFFSRTAVMAFLVSLLWLLPFYVVVILASALLGLLVSALCRRNLTSMTLTYLIVAFCCFVPLLGQGLGGKMVAVSYQFSNEPVQDFLGILAKLIEFLAETLGPWISPFYFLAGNESRLSAMGCYRRPEEILFYGVVWLVILGLMFLGTIAAMRRSVTHEVARKA